VTLDLLVIQPVVFGGLEEAIRQVAARSPAEGSVQG